MSAASLRALSARVQMMVARVIVRRTDDSTMFQEHQVEALEDEVHDGVEHFQPYGFTAHPFPDAEGLMLSVGGLRGHGIVIGVGDRRYRLKGLAEGEVALHDDQGQTVHLTRNGIVISSPLGVSIETDGDLAFSAEGNVSFEAGGTFGISADGAVSLGGASLTTDIVGAIALNSDDIGIGNGAALKAARDTDPINDSTDRIAGGSSKVRIA